MYKGFSENIKAFVEAEKALEKAKINAIKTKYDLLFPIYEEAMQNGGYVEYIDEEAKQIDRFDVEIDENQNAIFWYRHRCIEAGCFYTELEYWDSFPVIYLEPMEELEIEEE